MAFTTLIIIITTMLLIGGLFGYFLRPSVQWCVHVFRRLYFRPKILLEHQPKLPRANQSASNSRKEL